MGVPTNPDIVYNLHLYTNLISYPFAGSSPIIATIPDDTITFRDPNELIKDKLSFEVKDYNRLHHNSCERTITFP